MKTIFRLLVILLWQNLWPAQVFSQTGEADTLSLLFIGDIMGHDGQISAAYDSATNTFSYQEVFHYLKPVISSADFAIGNLEVTLAGPPYKGYPRFSSPDELAVACRASGLDVLVTANNHALDRGDAGLVRTIEVLDSLGIAHTGTFRDEADRQQNNLLVLEKKNIRLGLLNYTYGTNGLRPGPQVVVNYLDTLLMKEDIAMAKTANIDKLIVFLHWGAEYEHHPGERQKELARFLFKQGVDIIIGSHPHVLQKMVFIPATAEGDEMLIAYSLGNFVSNQRQTGRDGGAMLELRMVKNGQGSGVVTAAYHLVWVYRDRSGKQSRYLVLPVKQFEANPGFFHHPDIYAKMMEFTNQARELLNQNNNNIGEAY